jgi:CheY-like chemotaxis protein
MPNRRTILIVDDDAELREALVEQLALHEEFACRRPKAARSTW